MAKDLETGRLAVIEDQQKRDLAVFPEGFEPA
jgi:hypothetical protein